MAVEQAGAPLDLPQSRKVRALLAYLALAPRPVGRDQLCELLWDAPTDPRGELRWCLSKIRGAIGPRVVATDDAVALDLGDCHVDALAVEADARRGIEQAGYERQRELAGLVRGEFLEGLEVASPAFETWLTAQRRRFRAVQAALLEQLAQVPGDDEAFVYLDQWLELAPFDRRVHELMLRRLVQRGRRREAEQHLARAAAVFDTEGLDFAPIHEAWVAAKHKAGATSEIAVAPEIVVGAAHGRDSRGHGPLPQAKPDVVAARRASIAVMPFMTPTGANQSRIANAIAHDVTTRLAQLRSMFVIAHGSTAALAERRIGPEEAGRMLNVDFVVGGTVRAHDGRLAVTVELVETRTARIVWSELLNHAVDDAFLVLDEIGNRIVASIASEIEAIERNRAILRPPNSLDAWETLHRGLWHAYRFTREDNTRAQQYFEAAARLDPTFSRAWAGLSFTHFQSAFSGWGDRRTAVDEACKAATQSLAADVRDPGAHNAMGRALWLRGENQEAEAELRHAIDLSPNFALGHYSLSFVQAQAGDPAAAIACADASRALSPFDPLLFAMLGNRAIALTRLGRYAEAADSAAKGAARPNANPHVRAIAACTLALAGRLAEARAHAGQVRAAHADYGMEDFLRAFRLDADGAARFREGAAAAGL